MNETKPNQQAIKQSVGHEKYTRNRVAFETDQRPEILSSSASSETSNDVGDKKSSIDSSNIVRRLARSPKG